MIAFDVFLNREKLVRAGVGSDGVLTAITTWVRLRAPEAGGKRSQWDRDLSFSLDGYRSTNGDVGDTSSGKIENSSPETFSRSK